MVLSLIERWVLVYWPGEDSTTVVLEKIFCQKEKSTVDQMSEMNLSLNTYQLTMVCHLSAGLGQQAQGQ